MEDRTEKEEEHTWGLGGDHTHFTYEIIKSHSLDCRDCGACLSPLLWIPKGHTAG